MPMKVEAAIVTQKRPEAVYNTDSVNVNGKVMPREVIKNGYKGSGVLSGSVYFALTSSDVEGFADASVMAFNERAELFARSREPMSVFSGFFEDCRGALLNMERSENDLVCAGFYARGRKAVIARNGATKVYLQRLGVTTPVTTEKVADTTADFSGAVFSDVCQGDIFILLSPGAAEALGDKELEDILRISDGSVKRVVNYILKVALAADGDKAVSAVVIKVLETAVEEEIIAPAFVPDFGEEKKNEEAVEVPAAEAAVVHTETEDAEHYAEESDFAEEAELTSAEDVSVAEAEMSVQESSDEADDISAVFARNALEMFENSEVLDEASDKNDEVLYTEEIEVEPEFEEAETEESVPAEKKDGKKSRTPLFVILGIMLAVSLALIIAFFVVPAFSGNGEETTAEETTTEEESTDEETTDEETTAEESSEEETTEEKTTAEETTTRSAPTENTTSAPVTEATTAAPVVVPEQTTAEQEETEATTDAEEATTAENTTAAEEETTAAPETEPEAPATEAPVETPEETEAVQ